ncbi:MAG TPA: zinc-binding dehydrogenase [Chloroflexota bacterium]
MKAARLHAFGGPDGFRIDDVPVPEPGPGEVVVQVGGASINFFDTEIRAGLIPNLPLPLTQGMDCAGTIATVGQGVAPTRVGEQVVVYPILVCRNCAACVGGFENRCENRGYIGISIPGTYAEYVRVPAENAIPFSGLSMAEAASVPLPFITAWHLLRRRAQVGPGQTLLVMGAGGGVGTAAVQIGKLLGARVFAATSGPDKADRLAQLGADAVFDYRTGDPWDEARACTGGRGVDFILDNGGSETVTRSMNGLAGGGTLLICGSLTGDVAADFNVRTLYFNSLSVIGSSAGTRADLRAVIEAMQRAALRPIVDRTLPLEEVGQAHQALLSNQKFGNVVLVPEATTRPEEVRT